jgi:hypothetical protein
VLKGDPAHTPGLLNDRVIAKLSFLQCYINVVTGFGRLGNVDIFRLVRFKKTYTLRRIICVKRNMQAQEHFAYFQLLGSKVKASEKIISILAAQPDIGGFSRTRS